MISRAFALEWPFTVILVILAKFLIKRYSKSKSSFAASVGADFSCPLRRYD